MTTVQILGTAPNLGCAPLPGPGVEVWCANQRRAYRSIRADGAEYYTRWFNVHPLPWVEVYTPREWRHLRGRDGTRPIYLQRQCADIPGSVSFPREQIQAFFATDAGPCRYFTFSAAWLIALAIYEGFDRIELWGFEQRQERRYAFERPCFFYWVEEARRRGIEVTLPPEMVVSPAGDPSGYRGPLYGYETHGQEDLAPPGEAGLLKVGMLDPLFAAKVARTRRKQRRSS